MQLITRECFSDAHGGLFLSDVEQLMGIIVELDPKSTRLNNNFFVNLKFTKINDLMNDQRIKFKQ
jgi:hypothetical protein